ncbi:hypothetical protein C0J50_10328 [Silurus asotus]|uniref:Alkylated DNA repair protein AlkB homologue 8 N-terminal domain-containing protein n=1 Tax=Silurus asotus TaxID=30991 RepID=A0AAD5FVN1_SILAS|nr:hypothetical protein C0J50_10328 [Silurus asotus]
MTGKGREVADMMERRKRNGVGVILKEEYSKSVVEVKRVSDRVMIVKVKVEGMMINVISAYAPQVGCEMEDKERFWSELDEVVDGVPRKERLVIGADFNGHVGEGNRGDEEVMGRYGFKERNVEGQMVVDFAIRMKMAVVNTNFKKKEDHRGTYKSGGRCTQVDYVLCRRCNLKEIGDCKVLAGDSVARQHRIVVCRMVLEAKKKRRRVRTERRIRWWKLKEEESSVRFREEVRQTLGGGKEVLDDWATTAGVMREEARKVLDNLTWSLNTSSITKIAQQRLYFLKRLRKAHLSPPILTIWGPSTASLASASLQDPTEDSEDSLKDYLRLSPLHIHGPFTSQAIYTTCCNSIVDYPTNAAQTLFTLLPSGKWF